MSHCLRADQRRTPSGVGGSILRSPALLLLGPAPVCRHAQVCTLTIGMLGLQIHSTASTFSSVFLGVNSAKPGQLSALHTELSPWPGIARAGLSCCWTERPCPEFLIPLPLPHECRDCRCVTARLLCFCVCFCVSPEAVQRSELLGPQGNICRLS